MHQSRIRRSARGVEAVSAVRHQSRFVQSAAVDRDFVDRPAPAKGPVGAGPQVQGATRRRNIEGLRRNHRAASQFAVDVDRDARPRWVRRIPHHSQVIPRPRHNRHRRHHVGGEGRTKLVIEADAPGIGVLVDQPSRAGISELPARKHAGEGSRSVLNQRLDPGFRREGGLRIQSRVVGHKHFLPVRGEGGDCGIAASRQGPGHFKDRRGHGAEIRRTAHAARVHRDGVGPANHPCSGGVFHQAGESSVHSAHRQLGAVIPTEADQVIARLWNVQGPRHAHGILVVVAVGVPRPRRVSRLAPGTTALRINEVDHRPQRGRRRRVFQHCRIHRRIRPKQILLDQSPRRGAQHRPIAHHGRIRNRRRAI